MKKILSLAITLVTLVSVNASAEVTLSLPKGTAKISALSADDISFDVKTAVPKCPTGAMCEMVSVMRLTARLHGCVDTAELIYNTANVDGTKVVTVTVLNIHNPKSANVKCIAAPRKSFSINLGLGMVTKENVKLIVAEYSGRKD